MEMLETSKRKKMFDNMVLDDNSIEPTSEIHLYFQTIKRAQRHPYVFCKVCGKFGRKDYLKTRHVKDHPYILKSKIGFVSKGQEPNRDKFGDFEKFQEHFGLNKCSQEDKKQSKKLEIKDQLECQRFFWIQGHKSNGEFQTRDNNGDNLQGLKGSKSKKAMQFALSKEKGDTDMQDVSQEDKSSKKGKNSQIKTQKRMTRVMNKKRGKLAKDMRTNKKTGHSKKRVLLQKSKIKRASKAIKKPSKTLKISAQLDDQNSARKIKNSKIQNSNIRQKENAKQEDEILKDAREKKMISKLEKNKQTVSKDPTNESPTYDRWHDIMFKLKMKQARAEHIETGKYFKQIMKDLVSKQDKELYKTWEDHKNLMLKEREAHVSLYHEKASFESTKQKLHDQMVCTRDQRAEINLMITKLAKYAPRELSDYPKNLINNGVYDPEIWKITRAAETDEQLIQDQKEKLEKKEEELQQVKNENEQMKSSILSAQQKISFMQIAAQYAIQNMRVLQGNPIKPRPGKWIRSNGQQKKVFSIIPQMIQPDQPYLQSDNSVNNLSSADSEDHQKPAQKQIKKVRFITQEQVIGIKCMDSHSFTNTKEWTLRYNIKAQYLKRIYLWKFAQRKNKKEVTFRRVDFDQRVKDQKFVNRLIDQCTTYLVDIRGE